MARNTNKATEVAEPAEAPEATAPVTGESLTIKPTPPEPTEIVTLLSRNGSRITADSQLANKLLAGGYTLAE